MAAIASAPRRWREVRRVIEALGYRPNQAARVLKGDRTKTIGLMIPSLADPFFSSCAEAAQAVVRANDSLLIVTATQNDPHTEIENLNVLISHRVDGLLHGAGQLAQPGVMRPREPAVHSDGGDRSPDLQFVGFLGGDR